MKYFEVDRSTGDLTIKDETILLVKEFKDLLQPERNIMTGDRTGDLKLLAQREFAFMYLYLDWESPYFKFPEEDKLQSAIEDSQLTKTQMQDALFIRACEKYEDLQNQIVELRLLKSCMSTVENIIYYLEHVDVNERDAQFGKPIYKTKDVIAEIKAARDLIKTVRDLEKEVKEGSQDEIGVRGGVELGLYD